MTGMEVAAILTAISLCVTSVSAAVASILTLRANRSTTREIAGVKVATEELHKSTNSKMDELLVQAKAASRAEGKAEGVSEERERSA